MSNSCCISIFEMMQHEKQEYFIGLDVHKKKTTYVVLDKIGNTLLEGETATIYSELFEQLKTYLKSSMIGLEACTSYYTLYQNFLKNNYSIKVANTIQMRQLIAKNDRLDAKRLAEMLRLGTFPCSYIPDKKIQRMRSLVQVRHSLMEEKVRCNTRIQAFLDRNGVVMPPHKAFSKKWRHEYDHFVFLENKTEQLDQELQGYARKNWKKEYHNIQSITGIDQ